MGRSHDVVWPAPEVVISAGSMNRDGCVSLGGVAATKEPAALRRLRVLLLIPDLQIGGTEMDLARTLPLLDQDRFEVVVGVLEDLGPLADRLREAGIEVLGPFFSSKSGVGAFGLVMTAMDGAARLALRIAPRWPGPRRLRLALKYLRTSRRVARLLSADRFDVLHTKSPSAFIVGALANIGSQRRPLLMSRVSLAYYQRDSRWFAAVEHLLLRRVDIATGNSQAILRELQSEGIPDRKLTLIRNGIDSASFTRSMVDKAEARERLVVPSDALVLTIVANYYPYKGHADLLQALHLLKDRLPRDWRLLAAGRDVVGNLDHLRLLARERGLEDNVLFLGER